MNALIPVGAFAIATCFNLAANWLALIPWRRSRDKHWSEQARLVYPVMAAARGNSVTVPAALTLMVLLIWPDSFPLWIFTGMAATVGAFAGNLPVTREVFPRISSGDFLKGGLTIILMRFFIWYIFLAVAISMPAEFHLASVSIGVAFIALAILWSNGGFNFWLQRQLGGG